MKKSVTLRLTNDGSGTTYQQKGKGVLCTHTLHEFFDFPKDTKTITVTLSTKETKNSYAVRVAPLNPPLLQIHHNGDWWVEVTFNKAKQIHEKFVKAVGVEIAYVTLKY